MMTKAPDPYALQRTYVMRQIITAVNILGLLVNALCASDEVTLKVESVRAARSGNATMLGVGITNLTGSPIKAFRATLRGFNDFDEAEEVCTIEFTAASIYRRPGSDPSSHHIIKPGETIYYSVLDMDNGRGMTGFSNTPDRYPILKGRYELQVSKIAAAPPIDSSADASETQPEEPPKAEVRRATATTTPPPSPPRDSPGTPAEPTARDDFQHELPQPLPQQPQKRLSVHRLSADEISSWNLARVQQEINTIYARYGCEFPRRDAQAWANAQPWYHRIPGRTAEDAEQRFTDEERFNIEILAARRNALGSHPK